MSNVPAHFGDIMACRETAASVVGEFTPLERILLTANGNLQRIIRFPLLIQCVLQLQSYSGDY